MKDLEFMYVFNAGVWSVAGGGTATGHGVRIDV